MQRMRCVLFVIVSAVSACTAVQTSGTGQWNAPYPPPGYAHHVSSNPLELFWNCNRPQPDVVEIQGVAVNEFGSGEVRFLKITASGVSAGRPAMASARWESPDPQIWIGQSEPFRLDLNGTGATPQVDLYYEYGYRETNPSSSRPGGDTIVAVTVPVLPVGGSMNVVRNACGPS